VPNLCGMCCLMGVRLVADGTEGDIQGENIGSCFQGLYWSG
jgi:hypothetical protein